MALGFVPSDAGLLVWQAALVAMPRTPPAMRWIARLRGRWWAVVPVASIVVVIFAIRFLSGTAIGLTYLAVVAVPPLAAAALAWALRWGRWAGRRRVVFGVLGALVLLGVASSARNTLYAQGAAALLSGLSCVTLGVLLAGAAPPGWLKLGILAMAAADVWLVVSDLLQHPNAVLIRAQPGPLFGLHLPRLQSELFGSVSMGYGDLFIAAVLGAVLAAEGRRQRPAAMLTLALAALFDLLFLAVSELPATVPVALALVVVEVWERRGRRGPGLPS